MAYAGDVSRVSSLNLRTLVMTIVIGDGRTSENGSTTFTNPPPEVGEDYYIFIRLYSSLDVSRERGGRGSIK